MYSKLIRQRAALALLLCLPALSTAQEFMSYDEFIDWNRQADRKAREQAHHFNADKVKALYDKLSKKDKARLEKQQRNDRPPPARLNEAKQQPQEPRPVRPASVRAPLSERERLATPVNYSGPPPWQSGALGVAQDANGVKQAPLLEHLSNKVQEQAQTSASKYHDTKPTQPTKPQPNLTDDLYIAPPVFDTHSNRISFNAHSGKRRFGIPMNTWLDVTLKRSVTSADSGFVELFLDEVFIAQHDLLPANVAFLADPSFNTGTQRVDMQIFKAVLPDGAEIEVVAKVYDVSGRSGLQGTIVRDRESEVAEAFGEAAIDVTQKAIESATSNTIVGSGVNTMSQRLLENEAEHRPRKKVPVSVVSPQKLKIKIEKAF